MGHATRTPVNTNAHVTLFHQVMDVAIAQPVEGNSISLCNTQLFNFVVAKLKALTPLEFSTFADMYSFRVLDIPIIATLMYGATADITDVFSPDKQQGKKFAKKLTKRLGDLDRFWDVHTPNVAVYALNMNWIGRTDLMVPLLERAGYPTENAQFIISLIQQTFEMFPAIGFGFPLWTLNALPVPDFGNDIPLWNLNALPVSDFNDADLGDNSILIGEGLLQFFESIGGDDAAPDYALAHEFGHHVQIGLKLSEFIQGNGPESSRYIELMADTMAAYFRHHSRGASFNTRRIMEVAKAAFSVGDCQNPFFEVFDPHGTPKQREKAILFATNLIDSNKSKGHILKAVDFKAKFDVAYSGIVAP
jgi:hypothetical protein